MLEAWRKIQLGLPKRPLALRNQARRRHQYARRGRAAIWSSTKNRITFERSGKKWQFNFFVENKERSTQSLDETSMNDDFFNRMIFNPLKHACDETYDIQIERTWKEHKEASLIARHQICSGEFVSFPLNSRPILRFKYPGKYIEP